MWILADPAVEKSPPPDSRPEDELLLGCARTGIDAQGAARIRSLLQRELDWSYLIRAALVHRVMPLLYGNLNRIGQDLVPETPLARLRYHHRTHALYTMFLTRELLILLDLLKAHDIPALPYKGPALAVSAYGDVTLRQFQDLDLLVHPQDVLRVKDVLMAHGYRPEYHLTQKQEAVHLKSGCEYNFTRLDGQVHLELHWQITARHYSLPLDLERAWERLAPIPLLGSTVPCLSPEDSLAILCVHGGGKHRWAPLIQICDLAQLIRAHEQMDWDWVMAQARRLGHERLLYLGLFLAHECLEVDLPEEVWQQLQATPVIKPLAVQVRRRVLHELDRPSGLWERICFHLRVRERLWDKARSVWYSLTPNAKDRSVLALPECLLFLHYLLRPIRLVGEYGVSRLRVNRTLPKSWNR
jgi:hypothetical protein